MTKNIKIELTSGNIIEGVNPLVLIGPNGSGKTIFGADLATRNNAEFIGALRNIALDEHVPMQPLEQVQTELTNQIQRHRSRYWQLSSEIDLLFSKLLAEDAASAIKLRDVIVSGQKPEVETTNLMRLRETWTDFFPGRDINFKTYSPKVSSRLGRDPVTYSANRMSDGERVALYLGARVLNAQSDIVVIDEPEVHFHSLLAIRFWNTLEEFRPDIRFVYITHDLTFALSRQDAQYIIVRPNVAPEIIPIDSQLPKSLAESILGAASFSIYANRLVFCEGVQGKDSDYSFYSSWFNSTNTAVIPVGSCKDVVQCTSAFSNQSLITGVESIGIIDRDYWPDQYLQSLPSSVVHLPFHEIENIFCLKSIFEAVGHHLSLNPEDIDPKYTEFISKAKGCFTGNTLSKQVSERFKRRCIGGLHEVVNRLQLTENIDTLESNHVEAFHPDKWNFNPGNIFQEERKLLENALSSGYPDDFLKLFPGKVFISIAAKSLGMETSLYQKLVRSALNSSDQKLQELRKALEATLTSILPTR